VLPTQLAGLANGTGVPSSIADAAELTHLVLSDTPLGGAFPTALPPKLRQLRARNCSISGTVRCGVWVLLTCVFLLLPHAPMQMGSRPTGFVFHVRFLCFLFTWLDSSQARFPRPHSVVLTPHSRMWISPQIFCRV
jgi:hypothetical protein